jgi:hypothetical protein
LILWNISLNEEGMGQQQLLLLVLGALIVGVAILAGAGAFESNRRQAAEDALLNTSLRLAGDVQAWAAKPQLYGGAGGWQKVNGNSLNFANLGLGGGNTYEGADGTYTVSGTQGVVTITAESDNAKSTVVVTINGPESSDINITTKIGS